MKARLTLGVQWLLLAGVCVVMGPAAVMTGLGLAALGSRPLLTERGTFDAQGVPVRYEVFALPLGGGAAADWFARFARRYSLDLLPSLFSGLKGWLPPAAVWRVWQPVWERCLVNAGL